MTTRRFLLASGCAMGAMGLEGCAEAPPPPPSSPFTEARELMADQVAQGAFPGAVWLVAQGG